MKVFLSWSGERSKLLAQSLRDWIPLVLHYVEPWLSDADIEAGERWADSVAKELEASQFGIICVTRENVASPWVLFEAGALAKSMQGKVIPLLLDLEFREITGPLAQFQAKKVDISGLGEVIHSINQTASTAIPESRIKPLFDGLWPQFEKNVALIPKQASPAKHARPQTEVLEELVASVRSLDTRLREVPDDSRSSGRHRRFRRFHPMMFKEMMQMAGEPGDPTGILLAASMVREDFPWIYEIALDVYRSIKAGDTEATEKEVLRMNQVTDYFMHGPLMELFVDDFGGKEAHMLMMEFPRMIERMAHRCLKSETTHLRRRISKTDRE